jgi:DNA invertase Pin-like site-specific DNA recombinase
LDGQKLGTRGAGQFSARGRGGENPKGSVLIVENVDRFSRLKPRVAYNKLAEIIENGVDVVTLEDGKFHTKETLDDFATLVSSLAVMQRANEESNRKSELTGAAWAQKRKLAMEGEAVMTRHCPAWLRLKADRNGFEPIPERVTVLRRIVRLMKSSLAVAEYENQSHWILSSKRPSPGFEESGSCYSCRWLPPFS